MLKDPREKDIKALCDAVISMNIRDTGDYGMGGECPFCSKMCRWNDDMSDIKHELDCAYLIAIDLKTNL